MEALILFLAANPELVTAAVGLLSTAYIALSKRFGGESFHLVRELARVIAKPEKK